MKLTKSQRWVAYVIMLVESKKDKEFGWNIGFCYLINRVCGISNRRNNLYYDRIIEENFPELQNKKNKGWPMWDKDGWKLRRKILKQCIIETHP